VTRAVFLLASECRPRRICLPIPVRPLARIGQQYIFVAATLARVKLTSALGEVRIAGRVARQSPAASPEISDRSPAFPGRSRQFPEPSPEILRRSPEFPAPSPAIPGPFPVLPARSPEIPGLSPAFPAGSPRFLHRSPEIPGRSRQFPGLSPGIPNRSPAVSPAPGSSQAAFLERFTRFRPFAAN
jgi:hypothetical protein